MTTLWNDPLTGLVLFFVCAALAVGSLLNSMKSGGSMGGIILAVLFLGLAAYFSPAAFDLLGASPNN